VALAGVLAGAIALQLAFLLVRPELPPPDQQIAVDAPTGNVGREDLAGALCSLHLGVDHARVIEARAQVLVAMRPELHDLELQSATTLQLVGLSEILLSRYDYARVYRDLGLLSPEQAEWHVARDRERGLVAAAAVVEPAQAERFEAALFSAWQQGWEGLLDGTPEYAGSSGSQPLTAPEPAL
jgi:hypothetical protein